MSTLFYSKLEPTKLNTKYNKWSARKITTKRYVKLLWAVITAALSVVLLSCSVQSKTMLNTDFSDSATYISFVEDRIELREKADGVMAGAYGKKDGDLTKREICNVGGWLVHNVKGFPQWSFELYRMQLMSTNYYSALLGCASYGVFTMDLPNKPNPLKNIISNGSHSSTDGRNENLDLLVGE